MFNGSHFQFFFFFLLQMTSYPQNECGKSEFKSRIFHNTTYNPFKGVLRQVNHRHLTS